MGISSQNLEGNQWLKTAKMRAKATEKSCRFWRTRKPRKRERECHSHAKSPKKLIAIRQSEIEWERTWVPGVCVFTLYRTGEHKNYKWARKSSFLSPTTSSSTSPPPLLIPHKWRQEYDGQLSDKATHAHCPPTSRPRRDYRALSLSKRNASFHRKNLFALSIGSI